MALSPRLLKGSAFTPRSIPGLALWLDASDSSTLFQNSDGTVPATASSDPVGYWADRSGNGRHAVQATAGNRPAISATAQNGRKNLSFAQKHLLGSFSPELASTEYTVAAVVQTNTGLYNNQRVFATAASTGNDFASGRVIPILNNAQVVGSLSAYASANVSPVTGFATYGIFTGVLGGGAVRNSINRGRGQSVSATQTTATAKYGIGTAGHQDGTALFTGSIAELLYYSRALSDSEVSRIETYLSNRWGITLAPTVSNADAQDWINRVYANGGTVSSATAGAVNTLCESLESASLRDRFYRLNLFCGNSDAALAAVRTPLFRGPSLGGTQYGGTTDDNNNFVAPDYNEASGLKGDGSTKYLSTGVPMNFANLRDYHLSAYVSSVTSGNPGFLGADTLGDGVSPRAFQALVSFASATRIWVWYNWGNTGSVQADNASNSYAPGLISGVGSAASNALYAGSSSVGTAAALGAETTTRTFPVFVFAINNRNTSVLNYANARLGGYSLGLTMNATQVGQYNTALAAFNSAMGRA